MSPDLIDLESAYLSELPPAHIAEAASEALERGQTHYVEPAGLKPLREAIAESLARERGWQVSPDQIIVTNGAQEALFIALRTLIQPGDHVLAPDPGYRLITEIVQWSRGCIVPIPIIADGFSLQATRLIRHLSRQTRILFLSEPNYVTGTLTDPTEIDGLAQLVSEHQLTMVADEALVKGIYAPKVHSSFGTRDELSERVVTIGSLSKLYRMSGWRVGWIIAPEKLIAPLRNLKQLMSICSTNVSQWAGLAALTGPQEWLVEQQTAFAAKSNLVLRELARMGLSPIRPDAAYYIFADVRSTGLSSNEFADFCLSQAQVRVAPGTDFGSGGEGFVRLALNEPIERLQEAMQRVARALQGRIR